MSLRISFNLQDSDLRHFADVALETQAVARSRPPAEIVAAARAVLEKGERTQFAEFVKERYGHLKTMLAMMDDRDWSIAEGDRQRLLNALACFSAGDTATGAGVLDHAIMIELVSRDLEHDLKAYEDFNRFRASLAKKRRAANAAGDEEALRQRRDALQGRMHARRKKDLSRAGSGVKKLFSLFGL